MMPVGKSLRRARVARGRCGKACAAGGLCGGGGVSWRRRCNGCVAGGGGVHGCRGGRSEPVEPTKAPSTSSRQRNIVGCQHHSQHSSSSKSAKLCPEGGCQHSRPHPNEMAHASQAQRHYSPTLPSQRLRPVPVGVAAWCLEWVKPEGWQKLGMPVGGDAHCPLAVVDDPVVVAAYEHAVGQVGRPTV